MKKYKYILWDWNGTLFDDMDASIKTINDLMKFEDLDNEITSLKEYRSVFTFPVINYYKRIGFTFKDISFDQIADEYVKTYEKYMVDCSMQKDSKKVLEYFNNNGYVQTIISASSQESLNKQVSLFDIENYFKDICGISDNLAHSKEQIALDYVNENNLNVSEILFIGDTIHDLQVSKSIGCDCILVANGHQNYEDLVKLDTRVIKNIKQLIEGV